MITDTINNTKNTVSFTDEDVNASNRKLDHIKLAFQSQVEKAKLDDRFYYEPLLASHTSTSRSLSKSFMGFDLKAPLWVSSMTGGTELANTINHNLILTSINLVHILWLLLLPVHVCQEQIFDLFVHN